MSSEQQQIVDSIRSFLTDVLPYERFVPRPTPVPNQDCAQFAKLGALGVFGLGLAEADGGVGYSMVEEVLVARELGRFLVSPTAIATMIGVHVAQAAGDPELARRLMQGDTPVAPALAFNAAKNHFAGEYHLVDGDRAEWALAWSEAGVALVGVDDWSDLKTVASIDSTLWLARVRFNTLMPDLRVAAAKGLWRRAQLLVCAYLTGLAEAALDDSVEYAKVREQFQQPIGGFQAIKHRCADMLARSSIAWNSTIFAALTDVAEGPDADFQVIAAKLLASDAAFRNAAINIQNHGAYGFTGEHHAHLFVKRAHMLDRFGGDATYQKQRMLAAKPPSQEGGPVMVGQRAWTKQEGNI
ncbi:acyl-CoA dehydrogenase family protein [Sphingopyxis macrogoltabida]|nr:acyl-CoA dehydrogenase family protein [Sphingopyxis macrogoltabida]